jgi:hypothetical protein
MLQLCAIKITRWSSNHDKKRDVTPKSLTSRRTFNLYIMSNKLVSLKNTSNDVNFNVTALDNSVIVMVNPDVNHDGQRYLGSAVAMNLTTFGIGGGENSSVSLSNILGSIKALNPTCTSVVVSVLSQNFQGPGHTAWEITSSGTDPISEAFALTEWTPRMDTFIANVY